LGARSDDCCGKRERTWGQSRISRSEMGTDLRAMFEHIVSYWNLVCGIRSPVVPPVGCRKAGVVWRTSIRNGYLPAAPDMIRSVLPSSGVGAAGCRSARVTTGVASVKRDSRRANETRGSMRFQFGPDQTAAWTVDLPSGPETMRIM